MAYAALFVALGGVAWAAADPLLDKRGSVNSKNIRDNGVRERDLARGLRKELGLKVQPPADGPYSAFFNQGNSAITIEIGGGQVVEAVVESSSVAPAACAFQQSPYASVVNNKVTPTLYAVEIANSSSEVFQAEVGYVDSETIMLSEATVRNSAGLCVLPESLELDALS